MTFGVPIVIIDMNLSYLGHVNKLASSALALQVFVWAKCIGMLLWPRTLCCDWGMGSIPLVETWIDPRNAFSAAVFVPWVRVFIQQGDCQSIFRLDLTPPVYPPDLGMLGHQPDEPP